MGPAPAIALSLDEAIDRVLLALEPGALPPPIPERLSIPDTLIAARLLPGQRGDDTSRRSA